MRAGETYRICSGRPQVTRATACSFASPLAYIQKPRRCSAPSIVCHRPYGASVRCFSSGFRDRDVREAAKKLSYIFYKGDAAASCTTLPASQPVEVPHAALGRFHTLGLLPSLHDLPLWRADSVVLVGQQALLHVHTPHYVHMFDSLFATGNRPWVFGHVRLPAGSRNLGASEWALCVPGSRAPTVGVLMEVNRALRLEDGKLMVLATALCRIKVLRCRHETPYSRADVELLHEDELLETYHLPALEAVLDAAAAAATAAAAPANDPDDEPAASRGAEAYELNMQGTALGALSVQTALDDAPGSEGASGVRAAAGPHFAGVAAGPHSAGAAASTSTSSALAAPGANAAIRVAAIAARAAAAAAAWHWHGYEASTARASSWLGRCPVEGSGPADTRLLVTELIDHGVLTVVPFPDGPVVGRWDLAALGRVAGADAAAAVAAVLAAESDGPQPGPAAVMRPAEERPSGAGSEPAVGVVDQQAGSSRDSATEGVDTEEASRAANGGANPGTSDKGGESGESSTATDVVDPQVGAGGARKAQSPSITAAAAPHPPAARAPSDDASAGAAVDGPPGGRYDAADGLTGHTAYDLLLLERRLWVELDALAVLQARVHGQRLGLPLGLLQLRPSDDLASQQLAAAARPAEVLSDRLRQLLSEGGRDEALGPSARAAHSDGSDGEASSRGSIANQKQTYKDGTPQPRVHPASEGLDVYCHPDYPLERRVVRLSYAAAAIFIEGQDSVSRQKLLDTNSIRLRLVEILRRAHDARSVLAAFAAVKAIRPEL